MDKLTYEQRIQQIAEKMADRYVSPDHVVKEMVENAKIAVSAQADAIRGFYKKHFVINAITPSCELYLFENGYVPAPEDHHESQWRPSYNDPDSGGY